MQDSYRLKPNLTINYGLRYSLFSPPWETNGTEVTPTVSLGDWFQQRANKMLTGGASNTDPLLTFDLSGPANGGKKGYYNWDFKNFAPRLSFAYSPRSSEGWMKSLFGEADKTVIRGGFGMVYDRIGAGLLDTFDRRGSFGLSTGITAPVPSATTAPRLTGLNTLPTNSSRMASRLISRRLQPADSRTHIPMPAPAWRFNGAWMTPSRRLTRTPWTSRSAASCLRTSALKSPT